MAGSVALLVPPHEAKPSALIRAETGVESHEEALHVELGHDEDARQPLAHELAIRWRPVVSRALEAGAGLEVHELEQRVE